MKQCDKDKTEKSDMASQREQIIGLGERSFRKSYYPQLKVNTDKLERFKTLLDQTSDVVMLVALPSLNITDVNKAMVELFNKPASEIIGSPLHTLKLDNIAMVTDGLMTDYETAKGSKPPAGHITEHSVIRQDLTIWLELSYRVAYLKGSHYAVIVGRDISERKHHQELLEHLLAEKEALLDNALVGLAWVHQRTIVSCNKRLEEMLGYKSGEIVGKSTRVLYESEETFTDFGHEAYKALGTGESFTGSVKLTRSNGESFWCELTGNAVDSNKPNSGSVWIFSDVNQHMLTQEKAVFLSHHDAVTHLPNHRLLEDRLNQAMASACQNNRLVGLINLNIDRFKSVNDLLGYHNGNQLLIEAANRLLSCIGEVGTLCRQGADEFLILLPDLADIDSCFPILSQLLAVFDDNFIIDNRELHLTSSMGMAFFPQDGYRFEELLSKASRAMHEAKEAGRNRYRFFNAEMNEMVSEQLTLAFEMQKALDLNQYELFYQPQIDIATGELVGAEALIRWRHPEMGLISPVKFIPIAEETGLIIPIGEWVLKEACQAVALWREKGLINPVVAVNLSAVQFAQSNIEQAVYQAITQSGIFPEMLELELTESIMIKNTEKVLATVKRLQLMGCKLSIDDFGTGYSSLAYLKRFAVDKLKIDRVFIKELTENQDDAVIVRTIIHMAKSLGLKTIAEGIESEEILELLKVYRCDEAQGYFISHPLPADEFLNYLENYLSA